MIKRAKYLIGSAMLGATVMTSPLAVLAQGGGTLVPSELNEINDPITVVRGIIRLILIVAFVLAFIMLIIGGIRWILAGGDEKAVSSARNMITGALIGLVIVLVSYAIIVLVETFFDVNIITGTTEIPKFNQP